MTIWSKEIRKYVEKEIPIILACNKVDLMDKDRSLVDKGKKMAEKEGLKFFEVSARANKNIDEMF